MANEPENTPQPYFVQYTGFKVDPAWRRLPHGARADGRESLVQVVEEYCGGAATT
jgi:hypothetical protein